MFTADSPPQTNAIPDRVEALNRKHPEYEAGKDRWQILKAMVDSGSAMSPDIKKKILANPDHRPPKVIEERIKVAPWVPKITPILARFNSQLFEEDAAYTGSKDPFWEEEFFKNGARLPGDDDNRASFFSFLREAMLLALTQGKAIAQVDTPVSSGAVSRAAQSPNREDAPFVILLDRLSLWDWKVGEGGFQYVKICKWRVRQNSWSEPPEGLYDFTVYERREGRVLASRYEVTKILQSKAEKPPLSPFPLNGLKEGQQVKVEILLEDQEVFNANGEFKFPVVTLTLAPYLHLADLLHDLQVAFFNVTAGICWKLQSINFAMPVFTGGTKEDSREIENTCFGDGFYLHLPEGWSVSSLEVGGSAVGTAVNWRQTVSQDIKDILYQVAVSAADGAAVMARSAASKREDRRPEQILLETYGQIIREFAKQILDVATIARGKEAGTKWEVDGFKDFLGEGLIEACTDFTTIGQIPIPSTEFKREMAIQAVKEFANSYDTEQGVVEKIIEELKNAPAEKFEPPQPPGTPESNEAPPG